MANPGYGLRITQARAARNMLQGELATLYGTTQATISRWENERAAPSVAAFSKLAALLGIDAEWLKYAGETPIPVVRRRYNIYTADTSQVREITLAEHERIQANKRR